MSPLMVFDGDRCVLTMGAPGGAWIGIALMQVVINVLDWGMSIQEVIWPLVSQQQAMSLI